MRLRASDMSMNSPNTENADTDMMRRCLALSKTSTEFGEYPYAVVISRNGELVCETVNRVARDRDVTRHAEVVALSEAQKVLRRSSLDDCTLYANVEPCAYCSYAIRETRIRRVVYGLKSPMMGGRSRWNILTDRKLSETMPEVFAPPPEIVAGFMEQESEEVFTTWNPLIWQFVKSRGLFVPHPPHEKARSTSADRYGLRARVMMVFRRIIDRIGRA
jgi:tRNA(adenine34) deaminase